ncbi:MAG: hypothetical protein G01um101431_637 [Parcubacteria group bacterium Gr01-1014_31]|nr:MAG: hypothetical protein G01um101431_637 [Parcubacteria group bacterium Gr01-1014_31]
MLSERWSDRRFLLGVAVTLAVLSSLPYVLGWLRATPQLGYLGLHGFASGDTYVYWSYLWQARDGNLALTDLYTTELAAVPMLNTFWSGAGLLGASLQLPVSLTFHLVRLAMIPLTLAALWWLIRQFPLTPDQRRWTLLLAVFAGGWSGYLLPFLHPGPYQWGYYHWPPDLWVAESNVFLSAMHSGHMLAAVTLMAVIFSATLVGARDSRWRWVAVAAASALGLFSFHPFHVPTVAVILSAWAVAVSLVSRRWRGDVVRQVVLVGMAAAPVLAYYTYALRVDPVTAGRAAQNVAYTPAWYLMIIGYGWLVPGAAAGLWRLRRTGEWRQLPWLLCGIWLFAQLTLVFFPNLDFQRRLLTGLQLPLVLLSVYGFPPVWAWMSKRWPGVPAALRILPMLPAVAFVLLFGFTPMTNLANELGLMWERHELMFWPRDQLAAITALRPMTGATSVIAAHPLTSYLIPGRIGRRVVAGHGIETLDDEAKRVALLWFFQARNPEQQLSWLRRYGVTHVFAGPREVGNDWSGLEALPQLTRVYDNGSVRLYRVAQQ